jgi:hypothetical protein
MWLDDAPEVKARRKATAEAFEVPQPGDSFDEMAAFRMFVVDVQPNGGPVAVVEANPPCTLPRGGKLRRFACVHDFRAAYAYGSIPGYWVDLNKRGANVDGWLACLAAKQEDATVAGGVAQAPRMTDGPDIHPPAPRTVEPMLRFFEWQHLPPRLQAYSRPFGDLARDMVERLPRSPERTKALNELLYAKDWAVRAALDLPAAE